MKLSEKSSLNLTKEELEALEFFEENYTDETYWDDMDSSEHTDFLSAVEEMEEEQRQLKLDVKCDEQRNAYTSDNTKIENSVQSVTPSSQNNKPSAPKKDNGWSDFLWFPMLILLVIGGAFIEAVAARFGFITLIVVVCLSIYYSRKNH